MEWIADNWQTLIIGGLVAVQVINRLTARWDEADGPGWKKVLLLYTEIASIVVSRGRLGLWGWLKLPGNPFGGRAKAVKPPKAPGVAMVFCIGMCVAGCTSNSWRQHADQSIIVVHKTAAAGWNAARAVLHQRCINAVEQCQRDGTLQLCQPLRDCQKLRRDIETALIATQEMAALAAEGLSAYDALVANKAPQPAIESKQAEVQERVNRAKRQNMEFLKRLKHEGIDQ